MQMRKVGSFRQGDRSTQKRFTVLGAVCLIRCAAVSDRTKTQPYSSMRNAEVGSQNCQVCQMTITAV
ncbi:MAG: hypothetical protein AAGH67_18350 [Cyanobacteria bacterium P01_H01_bin.162]